VTYLQPAALTSSDTITAAAAAAVAHSESSVSLAVARHLHSLGLLAAIWDVGTALRASAVHAGCIQSARVRCCAQGSSSSSAVQQSAAVDVDKWLQEGGAAVIRAATGTEAVSTDSTVCLDDGSVVLEVLVPHSRPLQC
jgi:hypothetical protein